MAIHRSAMGKTVDMGSLISKNENVRAVGNMKVNARGDDIDSAGRIIKPVTSKVNQAYASTVGNRSGQIKSKNSPVQKPEVDVIKEDPIAMVEPLELTETELAMEAEFDDDELTEQIKAAELKAAAEKEAKKGKK